jgi:hypothetical protein
MNTGMGMMPWASRMLIMFAMYPREGRRRSWEAEENGRGGGNGRRGEEDKGKLKTRKL